MVVYAVCCAGWDMDTFKGIDDDVLTVYFESGRTLQYEEKLLGLLVKVGRLRSAGRHHFLDDAEVVGFEQVPALAILAPLVVFDVVEGSF